MEEEENTKEKPKPSKSNWYYDTEISLLSVVGLVIILYFLEDLISWYNSPYSYNWVWAFILYFIPFFIIIMLIFRRLEEIGYYSMKTSSKQSNKAILVFFSGFLVLFVGVVFGYIFESLVYGGLVFVLLPTIVITLIIFRSAYHSLSEATKLKRNLDEENKD